MTNTLTFHRATINGWTKYALDLTYAEVLTIENAGYAFDEAPDGRILIGIDLTRPEREFTVGPYTITID